MAKVGLNLQTNYFKAFLIFSSINKGITGFNVWDEGDQQA